MNEIRWNIPMKLVSFTNKGEHWAARHKRNKTQKREIWVRFVNDKPEIEFPCFIVLTRNGPQMLDDDNLIAAFKSIKDEIANQLIPGLAPGRADASSDILWHYKQKKSKIYSIDVVIKPFFGLTLNLQDLNDA
jgi:hypothetical protein